MYIIYYAYNIYIIYMYIHNVFIFKQESFDMETLYKESFQIDNYKMKRVIMSFMSEAKFPSKSL